MSRKVIASISVVAALVFGMVMPAFAAPETSCERGTDLQTGSCIGVITFPSSQPPAVASPAKPVDPNADVLRCHKLDPQPPSSVDLSKNAWFECQTFSVQGEPRNDRSVKLWPIDDAPQAAPDPKVLVNEAVAQLHMTVPERGMVPRTGQGIIGVPVWLWVANNTPETMGPLAKSVAKDGVQVSLRSRVKKIVWDMGDGTTISCGAGTPWRPSDKADPSPTCGHTYQRVGTYTITGTVYWETDWDGAGQHGTIPMQLTIPPTALVMRDVQVLNTAVPRR